MKAADLRGIEEALGRAEAILAAAPPQSETEALRKKVLEVLREVTRERVRSEVREKPPKTP